MMVVVVVVVVEVRGTRLSTGSGGRTGGLAAGPSTQPGPTGSGGRMGVEAADPFLRSLQTFHYQTLCLNNIYHIR